MQQRLVSPGLFIQAVHGSSIQFWVTCGVASFPKDYKFVMGRVSWW